MSPRLRFLLAGTVMLVILKFCLRVHAQEEDEPRRGARIFGDVTLTSNHIEHGLTQSNKSFALQTEIGYQWPQFKIGLWGSNVKFDDSDDSLNLRLYVGTKLVFTANTDVSIRYDFNRYYTAGDRNGSIVGLDLRFWEYHILYEVIDNWEGLGISGTRWGFQKEWPIPWNMVLDVNAGYNMFGASSGLTNYFDVMTLAKYKGGDLTYALGHNYNTKSGDFEGRGEMAFFLLVSVGF